MKSNSMKEKFNSFNFNSSLKACLIASLVIILLGVVILSIFNFNLGIEYTGGKVINIETKEVLNEANNYNEITEQVKTIITSQGFDVKSIQKQADGEYSTLVVKFTNTFRVKNESEALINIKSKLQSEITLNDVNQNFEVSDPQSFGSSIMGNNLVFLICAVVLSLVLILIYLGIRFKLLSGFTTLIILCHDILLTLSLTVLFRVEITTGYLYAIFATMILSLISSILLFDKLKENKTREIYSSQSSQGLANITVKVAIKKIIIILAMFLILCMILLATSVNSIRLITLPLCLGIIVVAYSSTMITLPLWAKLSEKFQSKK